MSYLLISLNELLVSVNYFLISININDIKSKHCTRIRLAITLSEVFVKQGNLVACKINKRFHHNQHITVLTSVWRNPWSVPTPWRTTSRHRYGRTVSRWTVLSLCRTEAHSSADPQPSVDSSPHHYHHTYSHRQTDRRTDATSCSQLLHIVCVQLY